MYPSHHPMINGVFLTLSNLVRLVTTASMLLVIIIFAGVPFRVFLMQQELIVGVWLATPTIDFFYLFIFYFINQRVYSILLFPVLRLVGNGMITSVLFDKTI